MYFYENFKAEIKSMAVASLASSAFTRIGDELGPETTRLKSVFPTDMILSVPFIKRISSLVVFLIQSLLAACPATMLTVLLLFSSGLTSDDVICSSRRLGLEINSPSQSEAISYSQGIADFQFLNAYCHQNLIDYESELSFEICQR